MRPVEVKAFGAVDERSLEQLRRCMEAGDADFGVLCADHHPGYSQPIGGGIAYEGFVSPSGVGYDIGCGNKAVRTDLTVADLEVEPVMREIARRISFSVGRETSTSRSLPMPSAPQGRPQICSTSS
jgi:tRNA-splicing ligase RtcB